MANPTGPYFWAATLSAAGDLFILSALTRRAARRSFTIRLLAPLAAADLLGSLVLYANGRPVEILGGPLCTLVAAANLFSVWAAWCWTLPYAHALMLCYTAATRGLSLDSSGLLAASPRLLVGLDTAALDRLRSTRRLEAWRLPRGLERRYHFVCWALPGIAIVGCVAAGLLGPSDSAGFCQIIRPKWAEASPGRELLELGLTGGAWVALLFNGYAFCRVHWLLQRSALVAEGTTALDDHGRVTGGFIYSWSRAMRRGGGDGASPLDSELAQRPRLARVLLACMHRGV